jgi:hypothetical protein
MKNSFSKRHGGKLLKGLLTFVMTVVFAGILTTEMAAQSSFTANGTNPPANTPAVRAIQMIPQGQFVIPAVAIDRLKAAIVEYKNVMTQQSPGSPAYESAFRMYKYYMGILEMLEAGKGVPDSIQLGLSAVYSDEDLKNSAKAQAAVADRSLAINLLKA